jgi:hypothetical protein
MAALQFACKMSTDVSCKINGRITVAVPTSLAVIAAPAGGTCYLVIQALTMFGDVFPEKREMYQEHIAEKFEGLWLFSCRWGMAGMYTTYSKQRPPPPF